MTDRQRRMVSVIAVMALTVIARLPFLLRGDRFFAADEAVEGLMARHVLQGEFPLFFWGQAYKGVPEVYAAAGVFAVAGSSVLALQAVTAAVFAAFVGVQFMLMSRVFSPQIAWLTSLFAIVAPPSLVYWSLVGVAEISITLLAGAVALLAVDRWRRTNSSRALALFAFAIGLGLWVQQYMLYYVAGLAVAAWIDIPPIRRPCLDVLSGRGLPRPAVVVVRVLLLAATVYAALGLHAFVTGGVTRQVLGIPVQTTHPQKLWEIAGALFVIAFGASWWMSRARVNDRLRRDSLVAGAAFLAGFSPYVAGRLGGGGVRAPLHSAQAAEVWHAAQRTAAELVPIVFGFRGPGVEPLAVPAASALVLVAVAALSYAGIRRTRETAFFHAFPAVAVVMFLVSGAFVDTQSFRYLMPIYAAVPVILAVGVREAWRVHRVLGASALLLVTGLLAFQEARWFQVLVPDAPMARTLDCVRQGQVTHAWADYWTSYKIAFLTREATIVASTGPDRYPPYSARVAADPAAATIVRPPTPDSPCDSIVRYPPR